MRTSEMRPPLPATSRAFVERTLPPVFSMNVTPIGFSTVPLNRMFDVDRLRISMTVGAWSRRMSKPIVTDAPLGSLWLR